ncbi:TfoX/Sxy family protein [Tropicibacter naphthalenivorans]|uniref:Regulator of competence-specific genes n=1 Tax=Tropicibacter naphthalenivorans TaxID=441103 RepID=A0A0P1GF99_9RHOB|nr:TfoX/Sxy family protein [Tropicibacter naphthalenivorans]CUH80419.1 Regulator of competence-specific genes [Tropicibacter naphthalenivorans]SMC86242.1 DNA transformation protein [Tropicibacter naphthalenivorans]
MAVSAEEIAFAKDLFSGLGDLTTRKMMGGLCLYHQGTIFAIVHGDMGIMLKGAGDFVQRLEDLGCTRWEYTRKDGAHAAMPYWTLPDSAQDDPTEAVALAQEALRYL